MLFFYNIFFSSDKVRLTESVTDQGGFMRQTHPRHLCSWSVTPPLKCDSREEAALFINIVLFTLWHVLVTDIISTSVL